MAYKGKYKPKNPEKYAGNPEKIVYRSSWERLLMIHLDRNEAVLEWASEEMSVPYRSPLDGEIHRYFPDIIAKIKNKDGFVETVMIEVKPAKEDALNGKPPERKGKAARYYMKEVARWGVNDAKFQAAKAYCEDRGWKFQVLTEYDLFKDGKYGSDDSPISSP